MGERMVTVSYAAWQKPCCSGFFLSSVSWCFAKEGLVDDG